MKFVNLTPHALNIHTPNGVITLEPSGTIARVDEVRSSTTDVGGIPAGLLVMQNLKRIMRRVAPQITRTKVQIATPGATIRSTPNTRFSKIPLPTAIALPLNRSIGPVFFSTLD